MYDNVWQKFFYNLKQKEIFGVDIAGGFDAKLPAEWESWLRMRRDDPPTFEQVRT